ASSSSVARDRDLDPVTVRIADVGRVVGATVLGPRTGGPVVASAGRNRALPGRPHRRGPAGGEADVAAAGDRGPLRRREEHRPNDPPADPLLLRDLAAPAKRPEQSVVEASAALEMGNIDTDVVDHAGTLPGGPRDPAERSQRDEHAGQPPDRDD